uniref:FAD dependent oxidoreductase domain-containing protein n=1 Tax=Biomphalaria glabrata TaxID=6526 RepID=A0A2C9JIR5_BIOGL
MPRIAVVGAGAVGLSTAVNIQKSIPNAKVTIIADKFGKDTTSNGAGGFFRPYTDDFPSEDRQMMSQWVKDSWEFYSSLAQSPQAEETGQTLVSGTVVYNTPRDNQYALLASLAYDFHKVSEEHLRRKKLNYKYGYSFTTVITQTTKFHMWLTKKFREAGGSIINKKLETINELAGEFDIVANCCGFGARELVGDKSTFPVKGHLVMVKAPWMKHFFLSEDDIYLIPHDDKLIIGGTREKNNFSLTAEKATRERILARAQALFPELKGAQVIGEWVGLRPARERVRFETEVLDCGPKGKLQVVHNYGHGGHGITLGWGSGVGAAQLVYGVVTSSKSKM